MSAADTTLWDYVVTYGGPSLFMTAVFIVVLPLVWFKLARPHLRRWPSRLALMLAVWIAAWLIAYGDVLMIAREAKRVCETEAGLRIYRTVEAEGFAGVSNIEPWIKRGFRFTEYRRVDGSLLKQEKIGADIVKTISKSPISHYEYIFRIERISKKLSKDVRMVRDISTQEKLGEMVEIRIYPGWADSVFLTVFGARSSPVRCPSINSKEEETRASYEELIDATLVPKGG